MCFCGLFCEVCCCFGFNEVMLDVLFVGGVVDGSLELLFKLKEIVVWVIFGLEYGNCGKVFGDL